MKMLALRILLLIDTRCGLFGCINENSSVFSRHLALGWECSTKRNRQETLLHPSLTAIDIMAN